MTEIKIFRPQIQSTQAQKPTTNSANPYQYVPSEVMDFAKSMESQFSELMLKEMQKTTAEETSDSGQEFYNGLLTTERAKALTETGGKGIKDLILDDIYPQYKRTAQNFQVYEQHKNMFNRQKIQIHEGPQKTIELHDNGKSE